LESAGTAWRWPTPEASPHHGDSGGDVGLDLLHVLTLIRRRWYMVVLVTILGGLLALGLASSMPRDYAAEAMMVLDPRRSKLSDLQAPSESLLSRSQADLSAIRTEAEMLTSPTVLREVVTRLDLAASPEQPSQLRRLPNLVLERARAWAPVWLPLPAASVPADAAPIDPEQRVDRAVDALTRQVSVVNEGGSYVLRVQAKADEPELAARIANTVAEVHLAERQRLQDAERDAQSAWLRGRLEGLQRSVQESDDAVENFRTANRLAQGTNMSALDSRINDVNRALTEARTRLSGQAATLAEAQASMQRDLGHSAPAVLNSPSIQDLTVEEAGLEARRSELQRQLGPRHPSLQEIDGQLAGLRTRIAGEIARVIAGLQSQVTATQGEIDALSQQLESLENERRAIAPATVELAELERRAEANRSIYSEVLSAYTASMVRESGSLSSEIRLLAPARPPLNPSGPGRSIVVAAGLVASAALGTLLAAILGLWRGGFGSAERLEAATGLPTLEMVPELSRRELRRQWHRPGFSTADIPIRGLAYMLRAAHDHMAPRSAVITVTSSLRGEGKSLFACQLARCLAQLDARVLLVDLDLWRPSLSVTTHRLAATPTNQEIDGSPVLSDPATGLQLLPIAGIPGGIPRSAAFAHRLTEVCRRETGYSFIVLDAPPVVPVPDVLAAASNADATLLLVRFEHTRAEAVRAALTRLATVGVRPLGTVLTRVVRRNYRRYGHGSDVLPIRSD